MGPVWLLLLLPQLLEAQVTPAADVINGTESAANRTSDAPDAVGGNTSSLLGFPRGSESPVVSSAAPTVVEEDNWTPAETFLYTGDASTLDGARCSRSYSPPGQPGTLPASFRAPLRPALNSLANTANFLNMIFQASDLRESTVEEDMEWYQALVRALLEADVLICRALLTFDADPAATAPQLVLRALRSGTARVPTIILQDLSKTWERLHPPPPAPDDSWFRRFKFPESSQMTAAALSKRVLLNDLSTLDTPKWRQGDSYVTNHSGVRWASAPYLDCQDGSLLPGWMLTLSTPFYGLKPDLTPEFRGVIRVDVDIQNIDLDQCATGDSWFADTHECNRTTMECVAIPGRGFRLGQYCCRCKEGYYNPDTPAPDSGAAADAANGTDDAGGCYPEMPVCLPCWPGCRSCLDGSPCRVQESWLLRASVLAVQGVFMVLILVSMLVAYKHRRNRRIRASGLLLLETILFGSLLLYFPVFIMNFRPSTFRCILLRWVRMLGFSIVYGTVMLKMYRVLKAFLSRTAQRVPYMSSFHLLRILVVMLMTVSWFLCAWTVGVLQNRDRNIPVFITATTSDGQDFSLCYLDRWDYMMAVAELLFLCWGSSLWTAVRPVPSAFHEPRYMGFAIHNELIFSTMFHLFRFRFTSLHPDWMLLLSFTHTHMTITVTLALLFIPKFLYVSKPGREEIAAEVYEDEVDLRRSGSYLNSSFRSVWSEPSVDPEDFRDELKKLYAQLEVQKAKKMAANNPHLTKKRSSRCALGRSIIKRIAEIPETVSRQCSRDERDGSIRSKSVKQSESFRSATDTVSVSISYKSSIKTPSPSPCLRKSQSDYQYVRGRNSLTAESARRSSRRSETDSLDIPPSVCKSASAQNLTIDTNLLHPDHTKLHKSWSLTSTTSHSMQNSPKVARSSTVLTNSRQSLSIGEQTRSALQSESFDKAEICPWEVEPEQSGDRSQKHVTYANSHDSQESCPQSPQALVCPWDFAPPVEQNPAEDKEVPSECGSPTGQGPVSASAPGSPRTKVAKDQRVFSLRTTTNKWLSVKSFIGSVDAASKSSKEGGLHKEDSLSQKSHESASTTPKSSVSSRHPSIEKKTLQRRSVTTDGKPCLVKQNAIRLSSGDSSDRSPRRLVIVKSAVQPWDVDDIQRDGTYENVFLSRQNSKRSSTSSRETASSCRTPSTHRRGSNRIAPLHSVSHADVCPWDLGGTIQGGGGTKKQQTFKADVCPWESEANPASDVCPWESQEVGPARRQGSAHSNVGPRESRDIPLIYHSNPSRDSQSQQSLKLPSDVCPWESTETTQPAARESEYANICPWDVRDKAEAVYENVNPIETKGSLKVPLQQHAIKAAVHPAATRASTSPIHHSKTLESCPWDFPDPPKNLESICPWEEDSAEQSGSPMPASSDKPMVPPKGISHLKAISVKTEGTDDPRINVCPWESGPQDISAPPIMASQAHADETKTLEAKADVCPWEADEAGTVKSEISRASAKLLTHETSKQNVCPWETEEPEVMKKQDGVQADVCPWDTEEAKVLKKQDSSRANVCPWDAEDPKVLKKQDSSRADVCPWDAEEPKVLKKQDSSRANVCPWDTEEPKVLKKQDSSQADVCPWDAEEPKVLKKQDSSRADVCPWDAEEPKVLKKQDSSRANVCPWDAEEPKVLKKQDSSRADVCPWDVEEPKVLEKQDSSRADVCPWDAEEPKVLKKQDSSRADVCPWDAEDPKVLKKQDSSRADVCPWDAEEPKVLKKQDSSRADVCPWDAEEPKVLKKQDSSRADVCPWDAEEPKVLKKQDSSRADVCPWDAEETKVLKKQDSSRADVCPWDAEEPKVVTEKDDGGGDIYAQGSKDPQMSPDSKVYVPETYKDEAAQNPETSCVTETSFNESKENVALGRRDALCPWEMTRSRSNSFTDNSSDVFTWEPENIPEEDEDDDDAECAAEALVFPPDF